MRSATVSSAARQVACTPFNQHRGPPGRLLDDVTVEPSVHCQFKLCWLKLVLSSTMPSKVPKPPYSIHSARTVILEAAMVGSGASKRRNQRRRARPADHVYPMQASSQSHSWRHIASVVMFRDEQCAVEDAALPRASRATQSPSPREA